MKKNILEKIICSILALSIFSCNIFIYETMADSINNISLESEKSNIDVIENKGWHESAYVKWKPFENADSYNVYYKTSNDSNYSKIDTQLIRRYEEYVIADVLGIPAGTYTIKIVPVIEGNEVEAFATETSEVVVDNYVREGFAFSKNSPYGYTTGAYNKDGSLKENADVIYITNSNKDSVTVNGDKSLGVGLTEILSKRESSKSEKPIAIRFLGKVEMPKDTENYMVAIRTTKNVTVEGVGDDATIHGYGFTAKRACNIEFRNFAIMWYGGGGDGDSISLDTENKNVWIHNVEFFYGHGKEADQAKGDGSIDLKSKTDYVTISYCHFWDSGKALVLGGPWEVSNYTKPEAKIYATYHHNWFDHSDSRHPRCVAGSAHIYNNYYDGVAKYGVGAAVNSSVFVENNYFRNCPRPMLIATQGSDIYEGGSYKTKGTLSGQDGGMIKEYGNTIIGAKRFYTYQTTPDEGQFDAYSVENRNEKIPDTITALKGGATYNNFDTDSDIMYEYLVDTPEQAKEKVVNEAGRRNGGDFKYTFDNDIQDSNSAVIPELQEAVINYNSKLISVQGISNDIQEETSSETTTELDTNREIDEDEVSFGDSDNDGKITINDCSILLQKILNNSYILPIEKMKGNYTDYLDVDLDNKLSSVDVSMILQKALDGNFIMPIERDRENQDGDETKKTTETTTQQEVVLTGDWNADQEIPSWLDITGSTIGTVSSSHTVFKNSEITIATQKNRYTVPKKSAITINLNSKSIVKVYIAGNNNSDGKGTVTAELDGTNVGTYSMPGRMNPDAEPLIINTTKGGILKLTGSYDGLLYKITVIGDSEQETEKAKYDVTFKINNKSDLSTDFFVGENKINVLANDTTEKVVNLEQGKYFVGVSSTKLKINKTEINVTSSSVFEFDIEAISENVVVLNQQGVYIDAFETISDALSADSTVSGSIISVKPGYYNETFDISKSITLKKADDCDGEVVIYSSAGSYGGSMKGIIRVSAGNVTLKDLTLLNNTNATYKDINGISSNGTTAAALIADGDNSIYDNCKFISVQDTVNTAHYSKGKPLLKQTYNNCVFYGATDFICGACDIDFNNCEFRIFSGTLAEKKDAYVFAPNTEAKWRVNGGELINDENSVVENFFYARAWESNSSNSQTLDIFGLKSNLNMGKKGLMGFGSSTGGGASHSIDEFQFNVYEGSDKNSPLIATSNVTGIDIFEMSDKPVIEFTNNNSANLLVGNFGKGLSEKFIQNILPDIVEIGFVVKKNASQNFISDTNTIKIKSVYKSLTSDKNSSYDFSQTLTGENCYLGCGILSGINGEETITVVPYVKYDPITDSSKNVDCDYIYKFGNPVEVVLKGNGEMGSFVTPEGEFKNFETGILDNGLLTGIGQNIYSNLVG